MKRKEYSFFFPLHLQSAYLYFEDEEERINYIYMETEQSLLAKWYLVDKYDLRGVSLWRLGAIPDFVYKQLGKLIDVEKIHD